MGAYGLRVFAFLRKGWWPFLSPMTVLMNNLRRAVVEVTFDAEVCQLRENVTVDVVIAQNEFCDAKVATSVRRAPCILPPLSLRQTVCSA